MESTVLLQVCSAIAVPQARIPAHQGLSVPPVLQVRTIPTLEAQPRKPANLVQRDSTLFLTQALLCRVRQNINVLVESFELAKDFLPLMVTAAHVIPKAGSTSLFLPLQS